MNPIPTDLYYAELSAPDSTSWNKDGDSYWGEVLTDTVPGGDDSPDYVADVYMGRIPWSDVSKIQHIIAKIIKFERNTDLSYKKKALCAGGMLFFDNENHNTWKSLVDGAEVMEDMINNNILSRSNTITLYEKEGLCQSAYSSTDKINRSNIINYCQGVGIFAEFNHGNRQEYARKVWSTDTDGDSIPEDNEFTWPLAMAITDAPYLDDSKPAVGYLMSCLKWVP